MAEQVSLELMRFEVGLDETGDYCTVDAKPWRDDKEPAMYHPPISRKRAESRCAAMNQVYSLARREFGDPARRALIESGLLNLRYRQTVIDSASPDGTVDAMPEGDRNEVSLVDRVLKRIGEAIAAIDGGPSDISASLIEPKRESIGVLENEVVFDPT